MPEHLGVSISAATDQTSCQHTENRCVKRQKILVMTRVYQQIMTRKRSFRNILAEVQNVLALFAGDVSVPMCHGVNCTSNVVLLRNGLCPQCT